MKCLTFLSAVVCASILHVTSANASVVAITSLYVESVSASLLVNQQSFFNVTRQIPPFEITMGEYQDPALHITNGNRYIDFYTTGAFGAPAPTGYVNGTAINVNLSSMRMEIGINNRGALFDVGLWPFNTPMSSGVYDPNTGSFTLSWYNSFGGDRSGERNNLAGRYVVQLSGYVTTSAVPVPAALWLFGSGLLTMVGFVRRNKITAK